MSETNQTVADNAGQGQSGQETVPPTQTIVTPSSQAHSQEPPQQQQQTTPPAQNQQGAKKPNAILGKGGKPLPEGPVNIGMKTVEIPDEAAQANGFYTENVGALTAQFPQFKHFNTLGEQLQG